MCFKPTLRTQSEFLDTCDIIIVARDTTTHDSVESHCSASEDGSHSPLGCLNVDFRFPDPVDIPSHANTAPSRVELGQDISRHESSILPVPMGSTTNVVLFSYNAPEETRTSAASSPANEHTPLSMQNLGASVSSAASNAQTHSRPMAVLSRAPNLPCFPTLEQAVHDFRGQVLKILTPKSEASLTGIPGELRNKIYNYLDCWDGVVCLDCPHAQGATDYERLRKPALTRVCRTLRRETLFLYYHTNRFQTTCSWNDGGHVSCLTSHSRSGLLQRSWLSSVEPFRGMIKDVRFRLPGWNTWTRFQLVEMGFDHGLIVTTGRPLSPMRTALLQLLIDSYYFADGRPTGEWVNEDLFQLLLEVPRVVERIEAEARLAVDLMTRLPDGVEVTWDTEFGGFLQVGHFQSVGGSMWMPPTVSWQALTTDLESVLGESVCSSALLVRKEAFLPAMTAMIGLSHFDHTHCFPREHKRLMREWQKGFY